MALGAFTSGGLFVSVLRLHHLSTDVYRFLMQAGDFFPWSFMRDDSHADQQE